jgi:putative FmdB family regulatory protein
LEVQDKVPTYEYECPECKFRFEEFERMTASTEKDCPSCGATAHRLISGGGGIIFKGEGFHCNDYGNKKADRRCDSCPHKKDDD